MIRPDQERQLREFFVPAVLAEGPVIDLAALGGGAHYCLGHALARQELEVALGTLLRRCPKLTLDTLDPPFRETSLMRGVVSLAVHW